MKENHKLFVFDLDHTLILGSYRQLTGVNLLFQYSKYLWVYERPYAREFVKYVQKSYDTAIVTTAKADYAKRISKYLDINPVFVKTRRDCMKGGKYLKTIPDEYLERYQRITVLDDTLSAWSEALPEKVVLVRISEFRGEKDDKALQDIDSRVALMNHLASHL